MPDKTANQLNFAKTKAPFKVISKRALRNDTDAVFSRETLPKSSKQILIDERRKLLRRLKQIEEQIRKAI